MFGALPPSFFQVADNFRAAREQYERISRSNTQKMQEYIQNLQNTNPKIFLAILIDGTSSMDYYVATSRRVIGELSSALHANIENLEITYAVVVYRDPIDVPTDCHDVLPPTKNRNDFDEFMKRIRTYGGGDACEDLAGGIFALNSHYDSIPDKAETKFMLMHVLDAPAHGFGMSLRDSVDHHDTEEQRTRLARAYAQIMAASREFQDFEYHFFGLTQEMSRPSGTRWLEVCDEYERSHFLVGEEEFEIKNAEFLEALRMSRSITVGQLAKYDLPDEFCLKHYARVRDTMYRPDLSFLSVVTSLLSDNMEEDVDIDKILKVANPNEDFGDALMSSAWSSVARSSTKVDVFAGTAGSGTRGGRRNGSSGGGGDGGGGSSGTDFMLDLGKTNDALLQDMTRYGLQFGTKTCQAHVLTRTNADFANSLLILSPVLTFMTHTGNPADFVDALVKYTRTGEEYDDYIGFKTWFWNNATRSSLNFSDRDAEERRSKRRKSTITDTYEHSLFCVHPRPCGKGAESTVFHACYTKFTGSDAQESVDHLRDNVIRSSLGEEFQETVQKDFEPCVLKFSTTAGMQSSIEDKMEVHATVRFLADLFKQRLRGSGLELYDIHFLVPFMMTFDASKTSFMGCNKTVFARVAKSKSLTYSVFGEASMCEYRDVSFVKFINNNGMRNSKMTSYAMNHQHKKTYNAVYIVLDIFVLFCWRVTQGNMVPSDLQGKVLSPSELDANGNKHSGGEGEGEGDASTSTSTSHKGARGLFLLTDVTCTAVNLQAFEKSLNLGSYFVRKIASAAWKEVRKNADDAMLSKILNVMEAQASDFDGLL